MTPGPAVRRILMTADTVGGVWTYALELARALAGHGLAVDLAAMGRPMNPAQRRAAWDVPGLRVHESAFRLEWMDDPWEDVDRAGQWLLALERALAPGVVHVNGYAHAALPFAAPVLVVAHSCVLSWWREVRGEDAPPDRWGEYARRVRLGLAGARAVAAPSRAMLAAVRDLYAPACRCMVIPNCRRSDLFRPGRKESFVLAAGRFWDAAKNLDALAAVAPDLPWPVRVVGECGGRDAGNIDCLGFLDEPALAAWLSRAAVYALPARYEPFGLSVLEAALSGCALVLGDIPSLRENWDDAALFVSPDDRPALTEALTRLARDPALRDRLGRRARDRAVRFTPARTARGYLDLYRALRAHAACPADSVA